MRRVVNAVEKIELNEVPTFVKLLESGEVTTFRKHRGIVIEVVVSNDNKATVRIAHTGPSRCGCATYDPLRGFNAFD